MGPHRRHVDDAEHATRSTARVLGLAAVVLAGCTRDRPPLGGGAVPGTTPKAVATSGPSSPASSPASSPSSFPPSAPPAKSAGERPLTQEEIDDRCGWHGGQICCLGPPIPGPPPKPMCHAP